MGSIVGGVCLGFGWVSFEVIRLLSMDSILVV